VCTPPLGGPKGSLAQWERLMVQSVNGNLLEALGQRLRLSAGGWLAEVL